MFDVTEQWKKEEEKSGRERAIARVRGNTGGNTGGNRGGMVSRGSEQLREKKEKNVL